jgi:membrane-associated protein
MTFHQIILFLIKYKYEAIIPIAIAEGPIISVISGFLVSLGYVNFLYVLIILFLGDTVSDYVFYLMGKGGRHAIGYFKLKHVPEEQILKFENQFKSSPWKTMVLAKVSYGLGGVFMAACGASRMGWRKFLEYVLSLNFIRSLILLSVGFYFGKAAIHLGRAYLKYYILAVVILVPLAYLIYYKKFRKSK